MRIYLYIIKNKENGKVYIGQTVDFDKRTREHIYGRGCKKNCLIDRAIKKHGKNMFSFDVIDIAYSQEDADDLERMLIEEFNSIKPNGYNVLKGGRKQHGSWNQRKVYMYDLDGNYICEYESASEASRKVEGCLSTGIIGCCKGKQKRCGNYKFSYVKRDKIDQYDKPLSSRMRKVYQFDLNGKLIEEFKSLEEASFKTGTPRTGISSCLSGKYKSSNGFIWSCCKTAPFINTSVKRLEIVQFNSDKEKIGEFVSCSEAERSLGLRKGAYKVIYASLDTWTKRYGYYWARKDNPVPSS